MSSLVSLEEHVHRRIKELGWEEPTPIQRKAFPPILRRRSALIVAPTGSGKTEAAVIPILTLLSTRQSKGGGISALYITPLRALNRDIFRRIISLAEAEGLTVDVRHGDTPPHLRRKMLVRPPDVLITTPETLAILLASRKMVQHLKSVEWVVIDEFHELISNERGSHLSVSLERLEELAGREFVRVALSATLGDARKAAKCLVGEARSCAILVDPSLRRYVVSCEFVGGSMASAAEKIPELVRRSGSASALVFTNTRDEAEFLGSILRAISPGVTVDVHHGSLSREVREETEARLRSGEAGVVVCTSSLELGMDIGSVDLVIQWNSPRQAVKLAQRLGRSRHRVGEAAQGVILVNKPDDLLESEVLVRRIRKGSLEEGIVHENSLDVVANHCVGLVLERGRVELHEILGLFRRAYPFRSLAPEDLDSCLRILERQGIVRYDGEAVRSRGVRSYQYYFENVSTIPDIQQFTVVDMSTKKPVGRLDQFFVGEYGEPGKPFTLKGSSWRIVSIDDGKATIYAEPLPSEPSAIPYWVGELIPVEYETAQSVGRLRKALVDRMESADLEFPEEYLARLRSSKQLLGTLPTDSRIMVESVPGSRTLIVHACLGSRLNQTLASVLSTILSSRTGFVVEARSDPYRILFSSQGQISGSMVNEILKEDLDAEGILSVSVTGTHLLNWRTWHVARKFGLVERGAKYDRKAARLIHERFRGTALNKEVLRELLLEKFDVRGLGEVVKRVNDGRIEVVSKVLQEFTPLARPILEYASSFVSLPLTVEKAVLNLVSERLERARHRLVCLSCGRWERVFRTSEYEGGLSCSLCRSRLIGVSYYSDDGLAPIVRKNVKGGRLNEDEEKALKKAWKTSSLLQTFGRDALYVLGGFGVGPETGARILRGYTMDREQLLKRIYLAERTYITTRGFWDD